MKTLSFNTELNASQPAVWAWVTSIKGILDEMMPLMKMTFPSEVETLGDINPPLGEPLCRSWILLLGVLPVDYSHVTFIEYEPGQSFVEESRMGKFCLWRHARRVEALDGNPNACVIHDTLTFHPKYFTTVNAWVVKRLFKHRHRQLSKRFNE